MFFKALLAQGILATCALAVSKEFLDSISNAPDSVVAQSGGMRVGADNAIVPDASSEHPLVIAHPEDQPLCKPAQPIEPSHPVQVMDGFETFVLANINNPRKLVVDPANHVLVISGGQGVYSIRMDRCGNAETLQILGSDQLDEPIESGLALFDGHLYVATANSVWRYPYVDGQHTPLEAGERVVFNINPNNKEATPDVSIDPFGHAYIPRTPTEFSDRVANTEAILKRFNFRAVPADGYDFETDGEVYAIGTNINGIMGFDAQARLWAIDGPFDSFRRADLGGDIAPYALAEELNLFEFPHKAYGFPYCFTEYDLSTFTEQTKGKGAQWGHPSFMNDSVNMDEFCQSDDSNRKPAVPLPPNSHASALYFFMGTFCSVGDAQTQGTSVGLPCNWTDTPIVAYHGASGEAAGHSVVHLPFDDLGHKPRWDKPEEIIFQAQEPCTSSQGCISPTGLAVDGYGRLLISSDETNEIFLVTRVYNQEAAQMLTDIDNAKEAAKEAAEEAAEEAKEQQLKVQATTEQVTERKKLRKRQPRSRRK